MDKVHISQFYSCSEISLSSELLYVSELGKYLFYNYNKQLSIDGVILNSILKKSDVWDYFRMAIHSNWICDTNLPSYETDITIQSPIDYSNNVVKNYYFTLDECIYDSVDEAKRSNSNEYNYCTPKPSQVCFTKMEDEAWVWTLGGTCAKDEMVNTKSLNQAKSSTSWVSMIAMVAVERLMTGVPKLLAIEFHYSIAKNQLALSDFMILMDETDCLTGWVLFSFADNVSEDMQMQVGYEAWWHRGRERGLLDRWYRPKEKIEYLRNVLNLWTGDIVLFYERNYSTKYNYIKSISSCHIAIIREITSTSITLETINTVKTKYDAEVDYKNLTMAVKSMYDGIEKYSRWNSSIQKYDITDVGVEYLMHTERYFILPLDQADDVIHLNVRDNNGRTGKYALHQNDAVYWILKDYDVDFDEEHFKLRYFENSATAYDVFMSGGELPDDWRV